MYLLPVLLVCISVRSGEWTEEEDRFIIARQREWGNRWADIARGLRGRTTHAVKNRYHQLIRLHQQKKINLTDKLGLNGASASSSCGSAASFPMDGTGRYVSSSSSSKDSTAPVCLSRSIVRAEADGIKIIHYEQSLLSASNPP